MSQAGRRQLPGARSAAGVNAEARGAGRSVATSVDAGEHRTKLRNDGRGRRLLSDGQSAHRREQIAIRSSTPIGAFDATRAEIGAHRTVIPSVWILTNDGASSHGQLTDTHF